MARIEIQSDRTFDPDRLRVETGEIVEFHFHTFATIFFEDDYFFMDSIGATVSSLTQPKGGKVTLQVNPSMDPEKNNRIRFRPFRARRPRGQQIGSPIIDTGGGDDCVIVVG